MGKGVGYPFDSSGTQTGPATTDGERISNPETSDTFTAPGQNGVSSFAFYGRTSSIPEAAAILLSGLGLVESARMKRFKR
jgi:hypothetical protein